MKVEDYLRMYNGLARWIGLAATYYVNNYPHKLPCYGLCTGVAFPAKYLF